MNAETGLSCRRAYFDDGSAILVSWRHRTSRWLIRTCRISEASEVCSSLDAATPFDLICQAVGCDGFSASRPIR